MTCMTQDVVWRELCRAAIVELNPPTYERESKLPVQPFDDTWNGYPEVIMMALGEERQAMTDALENLQTLQRVELGSLTKPATASDESPNGGAL
jgi:hypothetical protein